MSRHPLHDAEFVARYGTHRRRGTSTAQALEYIAQAIRHPGERVELRDHAAYGTRNRANEHLAGIIGETAYRLGLQHLHVYRSSGHLEPRWWLVFENRAAQEDERRAAQAVRIQAVADAASAGAAARAAATLRNGGT